MSSPSTTFLATLSALIHSLGNTSTTFLATLSALIHSLGNTARLYRLLSFTLKPLRGSHDTSVWFPPTLCARLSQARFLNLFTPQLLFFGESQNLLLFYLHILSQSDILQALALRFIFMLMILKISYSL